jgi:serine/threonine protein kinase
MGKSSDKHSYSSSSDSENTKDIDDSIGHYQIEFGQTISDRYHLKDQCGIGTFGKVYLALDSKKNDYVAIKVVRKIKRYVESAKIEADVLCDIRDKQFKENKSSCVEMFSDFDFNGFYCLVFEPLGISIYDFIKLNNYKGFSLDIVKDFSYQLLDAIAFLHSHKLIHTDLKLENILLIDNSVDIHDKSSGRRISSTPNYSNKRPRLSENDRINSPDPLPPLSTISPPDQNSYLVPRNRKIKSFYFYSFFNFVDLYIIKLRCYLCYKNK